jgi:hypothetical protein
MKVESPALSWEFKSLWIVLNVLTNHLFGNLPSSWAFWKALVESPGLGLLSIGKSEQ